MTDHRDLFDRVAGHLAVTAQKLQRTPGETRLDANDVAALFMATAYNALATEVGTREALHGLRELLDDIEAGDVARRIN